MFVYWSSVTAWYVIVAVFVEAMVVVVDFVNKVFAIFISDVFVIVDVLVIHVIVVYVVVADIVVIFDIVVCRFWDWRGRLNRHCLC